MDAHPDMLPIPAALSASPAARAARSAKPAAPQPGVTLLQRLPETLSGRVKLRRRRRLWKEWVPATAHLRGTALMLETRNDAVLALDVSHVSHIPRAAGAIVTIRSSTSQIVRIRVAEKAHEWLAALHAVSRAPHPRLADFTVLDPVGKGGGGEVYLVRQKAPQLAHLPLAMKVVKKHDAFYSDGSLRRALDERLVLELVRGFPFVATLTHAFQTNTALYMVSDFYAGGDLKTLLRRQTAHRLSEPSARRLMAQVILALEHIHSLNIIYRDLKPENILLTSEGDVRLCDFGLSKLMSTGRFGRTRSFCGSTSYMSPQIVTGKTYSIATDLWSLGILFYRMLVGATPFEQSVNILGSHNEPHDVHKRIQLEDPHFPSFLSPAAREMLEGLLRKSENDRLNLQDLKEALFFRDVDWNAVVAEGYERAARPSAALEGDETQNFDPQRLISHGVALDDKELHAKHSARKTNNKPDPAELGNEPSRSAFSFVSRHASRLTSLSLRSDLHVHKHKKQPVSTSVVGFGYSYASSGSLGPSDTDNSSSTKEQSAA